MSPHLSESPDFDIIIVGAGISGINTAYRLQTQSPSTRYTILEERTSLGGTWDLFRYPGIRSDSDLFTFGFSWRPWTKNNAIADGESIRTYLRESAQQYGIDRHIHYRHKLIAADWSSKAQAWTLSVDANGERKTLTALFIVMGTGYYDYHEALKADIPGLNSFQGQVIHPQFWPEDVDYLGKKIVVIGSGATAVTLVPNLVDKAEHVTMLQRSPSYITTIPERDTTAEFVHNWLPARWAHRLIRLKYLIIPLLFFKFCRIFPNAARRTLEKATREQLPGYGTIDPDFVPKYTPWQQRLCLCPDGDFFKCLQSGKANIVTDIITTTNAHSITTKSGKTIPADIIITATGLKVQLAGGAKITVDGGVPVIFSEKYLWRGAMLEDVPNLAFVIGYTNASWTLGADATAKWIVRLLNNMQKKGQTSVVARVSSSLKLTPQVVLDLNSTYIEAAKGALPKAGNCAPWEPRDNYMTDYFKAAYGSLSNGLKYSRGL